MDLEQTGQHAEREEWYSSALPARAWRSLSAQHSAAIKQRGGDGDKRSRLPPPRLQGYPLNGNVFAYVPLRVLGQCSRRRSPSVSAPRFLFIATGIRGETPPCASLHVAQGGSCGDPSSRDASRVQLRRGAMEGSLGGEPRPEARRGGRLVAGFDLSELGFGWKSAPAAFFDVVEPTLEMTSGSSPPIWAWDGKSALDRCTWLRRIRQRSRHRGSSKFGLSEAEPGHIFRARRRG